MKEFDYDYFTRADIAKLLNISLDRVSRMMERRELPSYYNKKDILHRANIGYRWKKTKVLEWKNEVWDKRISK